MENPGSTTQTFVCAKCVTILRNLLVYGFDAAAEHQDVRTFMALAITHLSKLYELCTTESFNANEDPNLSEESRVEVLHQMARLVKLFSQLVDDKAFEFLAIDESPTVIWIIIKISQEQSSILYSPPDPDSPSLSILEKLFTHGLMTIRHLLRAKSEPNRFAKSTPLVAGLM
jgi:hypothetical protein